MSDELRLQGPAVTVFGDRGMVDTALSDELARRGRSIHTVTTPVGWLATVAHAVVRLDTASGESALNDLVARDVPATQLVGLCATSLDTSVAARLDDLGRRCSQRHEVSMIWYAPFDLRLDQAALVADTASREPADLAMMIADELGLQETRTATPSFATRDFATFDPGHP